eukprot:TRINITY_DN328_c0_g1_i1.p1 TRINITY_DN328_c0_g1~~TRINITY_DN328_c0_g1_i1.p1  ORF type:complete len:1003 (+),score=138.04 TRINITY_DN328_c0_g1_i1:272-3010(+)
MAGPVKVGDRWYVLSAPWWRRWCSYSGYTRVFDEPIPNDELMESNGRLRRMLHERSDFTLVSENAWKLLYGWYGGGPALPRMVILEGTGSWQEKRVEIYLYRVYLRFGLEEVKIHISRCAPLSDIVMVARRCFPELGNEVVVYGEDEDDEELSHNLSISEHGLSDRQVLYLKPRTVRAPGQRDTAARKRQQNPLVPLGHCGLYNLGNTCFMNSALQCLSNTQGLRDFFVSHRFESEINSKNPLGTGGALARQFGALMDALWGGERASFSPNKFKAALAKFAPHFSGYDQQDSHELLAYLLDGIHEDLNRVYDKPVVEDTESNGRSDDVVANEAWKRHSLRHRSVIVDLFQGQLKSTVQCPDCDRISITFDPFMYLSVPVQPEDPGTVDVEVYFVPYDTPTVTRRFTFSMRESATLRHVFDKLASTVGCNPAHMVPADVYQRAVHALIPCTKRVCDIDPTLDTIVVFECPQWPDAQTHPEDYVFLTFPQYYEGNTYRTKLNWPLLLCLPKTTTNRELHTLVGRRVASLLPGFTYPEDLTRSPVPASESTEVQEGDEAGESQVEPMDTEEDPVSSDDDSKTKKPKTETVEPAILPFYLHSEEKYTCHFCGRWCSGHTIPIDDECILRDANFSIESEEAATICIFWRRNTARAIVDARGWVFEGESKKASKTSADLAGCLSLFTKREKLTEDNTWYCRNCKEHKQAFKEVKLWKLPDYLVIHLKRFKHTARSEGKLEHLVTFPLQGLDMSTWLVEGSPDRNTERAIYDLYAVSEHSGGTFGGHYTAHALVGVGARKWVEFNDSYVSVADPRDVARDVVTPEAYVLFFERRGVAGDPSWLTESPEEPSTTHDSPTPELALPTGTPSLTADGKEPSLLQHSEPPSLLPQELMLRALQTSEGDDVTQLTFFSSPPDEP